MVKINATHTKRETKEGYFHVATTITICLIMSIFVFILATFIHDHFKKIVINEEFYFPGVTRFSKVNSSLVYLCHQSLDSSTHNIKFRGSMGALNLWHLKNDDELLETARRVPRVAKKPHKVAFMFLARRSLPLRLLWEKFFKGHGDFLSIYLHMSPEFNYEPPNSSVFYKRRIPSKPVQWGKATMIDAERRLLAAALLDFSNKRFVLLSETCIPLYNFTTIYNFLINSNQSFLSLFDDPRKIGRGRYKKQMGPTITLSDWRKGSQWFEADRELSINIISDKKYYSVFQKHCLPPCYMDEHYLPTFVNKVCPGLTTNQTVTWTDWSGGGSHPTQFMRKDVTETFFNRVRYGFNCSYNGGRNSICFLFARKFHPNTLQSLLRIAPRSLGFG